MRLKPDADSIEVAKVVTAMLNSTHHNMQDFTVTIPAALLAQQQRTQTDFHLRDGGDRGDLAAGRRHRHHEHRAGDGAGADARNRHPSLDRRAARDIVRQFLTESVLISVGGGLLGIAFGFFLSWLIARTAEWKTIVTTVSVGVAFGVSVAVGVLFGVYPAVKASRINPIEALRYE